MRERHRSKHYNWQTFKDLWGEEPHLLKVRKGPRCLRGDILRGNEGDGPELVEIVDEIPEEDELGEVSE